MTADEDKDGMLNTMEFVNALKAMPEAGDLTDEEALEAFLEVDTDDDGLVTWEEFKVLFDDEDEEEGKPVSLTAAARAVEDTNAVFDSDDDEE